MEDGHIPPDITEQSRNTEGTPPMVINDKTDNEDTAPSENIRFRSVDDGDEKRLSEDAARDYARKLVSNRDIIISETSVLARSWTSDEIVDEAMARNVECIFYGRPPKRLKRG